VYVNADGQPVIAYEYAPASAPGAPAPAEAAFVPVVPLFGIIELDLSENRAGVAADAIQNETLLLIAQNIKTARARARG
jgi:hypothetical protein